MVFAALFRKRDDVFMKKILLVCVIILAAGLLALCFWQQNIDTAKYEFFPEEQLEKCLVPELPALPSGENISRLAFDSEFYFYITEKDFETYVSNVYAYLSSRGFEYLGYRGDTLSSFLGEMTQYEFFVGEELFDHRVFETADGKEYENSYVFIWSEGVSEDNGCLADYFYIEILRTSGLQEYGENTGFGYNAVMKLKSGDRFASYKLTEEAHGGFVREENDFMPYALAYTAPASVDAQQKKVSLGIFYGLLAGKSVDSDYESAEIAVSFGGGEAEKAASVKLAKLESEQYAVKEFETKTGKTRLVYEHEEKFTFSTELLEGEEGVLTLSLTEYTNRGEENETEGFRVEIEIPYRKAEGKIFFGG